MPHTKLRNYSLLLNILCLVAGVGCALFMSEGLVRLAHMAPDVGYVQEGRYRLSRNPLLGYEPAAGVYRAEGENLWNYDYYAPETNKLGYRDYDHALQKVPGTTRIVVIGDSIASGLWIDRYTDTFPAVLEIQLRAAGVQAEVINLGVVGYNTQQEVEMLREHGLDYQPDIVVLAYCLNDRERNDGFLMQRLLEREKNEGGMNAARMAPLFAKSALFRFLRYRVFPPGVPAQNTEHVSRYLALVASDTTAQYFPVLQQLAETHGFRVVVAIFPALDDLDNYAHLDEHRRIAELAAQSGFERTDLLAPFRSCRAATGEAQGIDIYHPSKAGHACAGKTLAETIAGSVKARPAG